MDYTCSYWDIEKNAICKVPATSSPIIFEKLANPENKDVQLKTSIATVTSSTVSIVWIYSSLSTIAAKLLSGTIVMFLLKSNDIGHWWPWYETVT